LIDNASNALADLDGERQISISTSFDHDRSLLIAEVADTGTGFNRLTSSDCFNLISLRGGSGTGLVSRLCSESF